MYLPAADVIKAFRNLGVESLFHANSVATACEYLRRGELLSRQRGEAESINQTIQWSDRIDQRYDVWDNVFLDVVDIHSQLHRRNFYGPVLFRFSLEVLSQTQSNSIAVTRSNPSRWNANFAEGRVFNTVEELIKGFRDTDRGQMLMIRNPHGRLPFGTSLSSITLDNPSKDCESLSELIEEAEKALFEAAKEGGIEVNLNERDCEIGCNCCIAYDNRGYWQVLHETQKLFGRGGPC